MSRQLDSDPIIHINQLLSKEYQHGNKL